jgi:hypothetical protein
MYRCQVVSSAVRLVAFPAFAAVAVAGLNDVPDTIGSRSIVIRMRRRAPGEIVEPFRIRLHEPQGLAIGERLAAAIENVELPDDPQLPPTVNDRPADVWEPLLAIAQAAGCGWAERAAKACTGLVAASRPADSSARIGLLTDLRQVFADAGDPQVLSTSKVLAGLFALEESPWRDVRGRPLDPSGLAARLRGYEVRSVNLRVNNQVVKGYRRADLADAWRRYLPPPGGDDGGPITGQGRPTC